jgi:serine/threonine protein kinase
LSLKIVGGHGEEVKFNDLYEYRHFLGKGGFGYVVSAVHRETNKSCALKVSLPN